MITWIILPSMNCAIETLTLFKSAAAFETHLWRNGGNTEGDPTQKSRKWVIEVEESCCLRRVRRRGVTCPRTLGWTEAGTVAALENAPMSSFLFIKLLNLLDDGVSTVATCSLTIQLSPFSVTQRYQNWIFFFFFPDMFCVISWREASLKLGSTPPHTCCEERAHRPPWETCRAFSWRTNRKHSFLSVSEVSSVCLHTVCWKIGTFSSCVCSLEALWLFINRNGGERLGQKVLFTGVWAEIYNPTSKFNFSKVKMV